MIGGLISTALSSNLDLVDGNGLIAGALCSGGQRCDDFIFEIEVTDAGTELAILVVSSYIAPNHPSTGLYQTQQKGIIYNLRDVNGNKVTKETNPELFTNNPLEKGLLQEDLVEYDKDIFLKIDWGDETTTEYSKEEKEYNTEYIYDRIKPDASNGKHTYEKPGKYIIKVSGFCTYIYLEYQKGYGSTLDRFYDRGWKLLRIISFGDLNNTVLNFTYTTAIIDKASVECSLPFDKLSRTRAINYVVTNQAVALLLYNISPEKDITIYESFFEKEGWDWVGGDDFFHHFPKLIDAGSAMYYSGIHYVPDYCCADNKYLSVISTMFAYNNLRNIGSRVFYGCENIIAITSVFYNDTSIVANSYDDALKIWDKYIGCIPTVGDSLFENCTKLGSDNSELSVYFFPHYFIINGEKGYFLSYCGKLGSAMFKNCTGLKVVRFNNLSICSHFGDEMFYGCENLEEVYIYGDDPVVKYVGRDLFKGCKNLYEVAFNMSLNGSIPLEIPDNFLYDVVYRKEIEPTTPGGYTKYKFNNIRLQYAGYNDINSPNYKHDFEGDLRDQNLNTFYRELNNNFDNISFPAVLSLIEKYEPSLYTEMLDIKSDFPKKYYLKIGKNFFNEAFISQMFKYCSEKNLSLFLPLIHNQRFELYVDKTHIEWYNVVRGEAIPYWRYLPSDKPYFLDERSYYGEEHYESYFDYFEQARVQHSTPMPVHYDNLSEIPYLKLDLPSNQYTPMNGFTTLGYFVEEGDAPQ